MSEEKCKVSDIEIYKKIIHAKEANDKNIKPLPEKAHFFLQPVENCYVNLRVNVPSEKENDRQYLFDPRGELVNLRTEGGSGGMECNSIKNKSETYFSELLSEKRKHNLDLPQELIHPKMFRLVVRNCLVSLYESYQDDADKPLLSREWVFDKNENIVRYSELVRNPKVYSTDSLVN